MTSEADTKRQTLAEQMAGNPDGVLEHIARAHDVSTFEVVRHLSKDHATIIDGDYLPDILEDISGWGVVMIIVHTDGLVAEVKSALPKANRARGYFNFHGDAPFGGRLKEDACTHIAFVDRPFMGRSSASVQFFDAEGTAIFKVFVARDADRALVPEQLDLFTKLRTRLGTTD